jgi:uncharacterized protein
MTKQFEDFQSVITTSYDQSPETNIILGAGMLEDQTTTGKYISIPKSMLNRHGLIAWATGTGKTKTFQYLCEQFSLSGIPALVMDMKWDLSWISQPWTSNDKITTRSEQIWINREPTNIPVEFLSLDGTDWAQVKSTVWEFWPILFGKILWLNEVQESILSILFKYANDKWYLLIDLEDIKKLLQRAIWWWQAEIEAEYGKVSSVSIWTILRNIIQLESQWWAKFFWELSFDVEDLMMTRGGKWVISILRLANMQSYPKLFSTFMLSLLAEVYIKLPEEWDVEKPKLIIFIDEAHLIFDDISKELLDQMETTIKLIRSKWVGIYFCTQSPTDIPENILGQLGTKIQHALRAFTAKDAKDIKLMAQNFPNSEFYKVEDCLTSMGIGQALVTTLDHKGMVTTLAQTMICPPSTRMDTITDNELQSIISRSDIYTKYQKTIDRESASDILSTKIENWESTSNWWDSSWWFWSWMFGNILKDLWKSAVKELWKKAANSMWVKWTTATTIGNTASSIFGKMIK